MIGEEEFIDFYDTLQVRQNCDAKTLEAAYRRLAKAYHPDHSKSADITKFNDVVAAYRTLRDSKKRAQYDAAHFDPVPDGSAFAAAGEAEIHDEAALSDADDHAKILIYLYKKRRDDPINPGVVAFYLQQMLNCTQETFEFHKWYLKEKGFVSITEQGTLAITIQGVDHVIAMSRTAKVEKLLIAQSPDAGPPTDDKGQR
jgi:curved DNA-binding protein